MYKEYREFILLAVILFMLGSVIFSRHNSEVNKYMTIVVINGMHGLLYKNVIHRYINAGICFLMLLAIPVIFESDTCTSLLMALVGGLFLIFFFAIKLLKKRRKNQND
jgi:uncharacterized membrane protein (UPF0136 family)